MPAHRGDAMRRLLESLVRVVGRLRGRRMSTTMTTLVRQSGLYSGSAYAVLQEMADCANHQGSGIFPSVDEVAMYARMSVRQVQRLIARLESDGVLMRDIANVGRGGRAQWRLGVEKLEAAKVIFMAKREARRAARRVTSTTPFSKVERVTAATPFVPVDSGRERVTSGVVKGDIPGKERVTPVTLSEKASLYDPSKDLDPSKNGSSRTVEFSTVIRNRNQNRKCTHLKCGPEGCAYVAGGDARTVARVDFNRALEQVEMRAALVRK